MFGKSMLLSELPKIVQYNTCNFLILEFPSVIEKHTGVKIDMKVINQSGISFRFWTYRFWPMMTVETQNRPMEMKPKEFKYVKEITIDKFLENKTVRLRILAKYKLYLKRACEAMNGKKSTNHFANWSPFDQELISST